MKKTKSKSDKKHAIVSALSLLAFLFFLNILQSCITEQNLNRRTTMMFASSAPTAQQGKEPDPIQINQSRRKNKRSVEMYSQDNRTENGEVGRKSRTLLGILQPVRETKNNSNRQIKFIRNFSDVNNWTSELSQVSEKDLEDQKLKTSNFPMYWKNGRTSTSPPTHTGTKTPPVLRKVYKRDKNGPNPVGEVSSTLGTPLKSDFQKRRVEDHRFSIGHNSWNRENIQRHSDGWKGVNWPLTRETATPVTLQIPKTTVAPPSVSPEQPGNQTSTTPRSKRSDYITTPAPPDYDTREEVRLTPTTTVGLNLNTYQTFPVYDYYGHRSKENQTGDQVESDTQDVSDPIDRVYTEARPTTELPLFYPTKIPYYKYPYQEKGSYRPKYPNHPNHPGYYHRHHYTPESRYRYSPYRKTGTHEPPGFRGPVVLARYPVDDDPGFDIGKFLWTMFASFAKPLTRLVPSFAKESSEEPQCYDLLVCEAQRASKLMGPTAEALTTTLGTLLTWAVTKESRQVVMDAINSGRENTCQQQIKDCENRSGGKSTMTVIAQVMEMKLR